MPELLTPDELAELLRVTKGQLSQWRFHGTGPAFIKVGKAVRYNAEHVAAWLKAGERTITGNAA